MNSNLAEYYKERTHEYDRLYDKADRQSALSEASGILQQIVTDKNVLEIAAGTGYWTEKIAETAKSIHATDINQSVLDIAQGRSFPKGNASFEAADMYRYAPSQKFDALFGGFIWSHIPVEELDRFLDKVNSLTLPGGVVVFMDNRFVEGSSTPICETDLNGNTYQDRMLDDGTVYRIVKNFPDKLFLEESLSGKANDIEIIELPYYWLLRYSVPA